MEISLFLIIALAIVGLLLLLGAETVREFLAMNKKPKEFSDVNAKSEKIMGGGQV